MPQAAPAPVARPTAARPTAAPPAPAARGGDHAVDPDELRAAAKAVAVAADRLRHFDTDRLSVDAGDTGHDELADALRASAITQRKKIDGLVDELDAMADRLRHTAHVAADHDSEHARRIRAHHKGDDR
jgi:uncharacterized protein YukE